jgi:hypothetical protein
MGTGAQWTGSEWFVVEADESDGTHLDPAAARHDPHQRRGRPPRLLRLRAAAIEQSFDRYSPRSPDRRSLCARRPRCALDSRCDTVPSPTARPRRHTSCARGPPVGKAIVHVRVRRATANALARSSICPCAASTTCATPRAAHRDGTRDRACRSTTRPRRSPEVRRRGAPVRHPRGVGRRHPGRRLRAHPHRDRGGPRCRPLERRRLAVGWWPCSSRTGSTGWR